MINKFKSSITRVFKQYSLPRWLVFMIDSGTVLVTFLFAYLLRFNLVMKAFRFDQAWHQALLVFGIYAVVMIIVKSYAGLIRQTTIKDTYNIFLTTSISTAILVGLSLLDRNFNWPPLFNIPISIILIHYGIVTVILIFFRVFIKMFYEFASSSTRERKNVIIYGAGEMGVTVKKMIESDARSGFRIAALIDDDWKIQGKKVDGIQVYSQAILTDEFISKEGIKVFIFAINNIPPKRKKQVLETVIALGIEILETPEFNTWLNGHLEVKQLRKIKFEDLLGRDPITLDLERIEAGLKDKTILVTGAAGSIGSEIVRQLTRFNCKKLLLIDQAETPSFYLEDEMRNRFPGSPCSIIIADVTRVEKMEHIFRKYKPEIVFHAAAYKHVPVMEAHPHEAFRVNAGGTKIVTELAIKYNVEKFVLVSSDKAVNPTNVMGATKKICELYVQSLAANSGAKTQFVTTRFGNVLGSNGSVIPLFKKQIEEGGPVTVTDPKITRFFMTIPEACQLVLEASFMGKGGEIYVFDMGEPVKILDIATNLIRLSGLEPEEDIKIIYTGLRPGEKLYEELFSDSEPQVQTHHPKINIATVGSTHLPLVAEKVNDLLTNLYSYSGRQVIEKMQEIVPEYTSKYEGNGGKDYKETKGLRD
jgi:FlaA1/EpsC-like NDP-sugar epimerase